MQRPALEVADIFRAHGPAWRQHERGHLSLGQLKVMSAIEQCRSVALGGHALRCSACAEPQIAYNSCRNRHCPKCKTHIATARELLHQPAPVVPANSSVDSTASSSAGIGQPLTNSNVHAKKLPFTSSGKLARICNGRRNKDG